jgi:hypothetical protein
MRLFVFVDGSFANNKDFSSQIGYVIILANETFMNKTSANKISVNETSVNETSTGANRFAIKGGIDMAITINTTR